MSIKTPSARVESFLHLSQEGITYQRESSAFEIKNASIAVRTKQHWAEIAH